jgi:putative ABC transport system permease protein
MDLLIQDVRYGLRRLAASPLFTVMAILIIGLGIAANTAVFSAVNAFLLRPLPFADPERVVNVYQHSDEGQPQSSSFPAYRAIAARTDVFAGASAMFYTTVNAETDFGIRPSLVEFATSSYFPVLGLNVARGRWIAPEEDVATAGPVAVLTEHAWRTRFGSDPAIVGRTVRLGGSPVTIVGVGPASYNGFASGVAVDFWLSLSAIGPVYGAAAVQTLDRPQDHWFMIRGRLRDGVTIAQARAAMDGVSADLGTRFAGLDQTRRIEVLPARTVRIHPAFDRVIVPAATLLMAVVGLVLALVCSNLAIMLLLRGAGQQREISIRMAMGAARGRILRQFLTESLVLSTAGGVVGCLAAVWLLKVVSSTDLPTGTGLMNSAAAGLVNLSIDLRVLAFATALSVVTGVAFGLAPAVRAVKTDAVSVLGGASAVQRHVAMRYAMVSFQVALSIVLLTGTGLFIRSTLQMAQVNLGFDSAPLAMVTTSALQAGYQGPDGRRVYAELQTRLAAIPGVEAVVRTTRPPLGRGPTNTLVIEQYISPTGTNTAEVSSAVVSPDYFDGLGIRVLQGRAFRPQDDRSAPPVAIVNEAMARRYWGTSNVVGRRYGYDGVPDSWVEIVGVAADVKVGSLTENPQPQLYRPWDQQGIFSASFIVRTSANPSGLIATIGRVVRDYDSKLPIMQLVTVNDYVDQQLLMPRVGASILAGFSLTALVLAALGLYAVVAFAVRERTKEVGIRIALGARGPLVVWVMVRGIMLTVGIGLAAGLLLTLGSARALSNVLFNVSPTDPATLLVMTAVLTLVAAVAAWIPALRATRVDPAVVLRYQ